MISIVGRFCNEEEYVDLGIESALNFASEIILVVEKGSTDKTADICSDYATRYPDIISFYQYPHEVQMPESKADYIDKKSMAEYSNWAFSKATKKYVMKLDGDCVFSPNITQPLLLDKIGNLPAIEIAYLELLFDNDIYITDIHEEPKVFCKGDHFLRLRDDSTNFFIQRPGTSTERWYFPWEHIQSIPVLYLGYHLRYAQRSFMKNRGGRFSSNYYSWAHKLEKGKAQAPKLEYNEFLDMVEESSVDAECLAVDPLSLDVLTNRIYSIMKRSLHDISSSEIKE